MHKKTKQLQSEKDGLMAQLTNLQIAASASNTAIAVSAVHAPAAVVEEDDPFASADGFGSAPAVASLPEAQKNVPISARNDEDDWVLTPEQSKGTCGCD